MAERTVSGWAWLAAALPPPAGDEVAEAFARCFSGKGGARVLAHLRALTLDRALGPDAPESALRHLEGQRQLYLTIQTLIARGRAGPAMQPAATETPLPSF